jgi:hypothetical protein
MVRPDGIVSGRTLRGLIDVAACAVVLAHIGPVEMAVTNTLSVSFLRACSSLGGASPRSTCGFGRRPKIASSSRRRSATLP